MFVAIFGKRTFFSPDRPRDIIDVYRSPDPTASWLDRGGFQGNIVGIALATGVVFARFSRPTARTIYSRNAIVAPYRGITALDFRIVNERSGQLIEVQANVILSRIEDMRVRRPRRSCTRERPTERMRYFGTPVLRASSFERKLRARSEWMLGEFTMSNRPTRGFRRREVS